MNQITCDMCMDLMPLVHDGVASADSAAAVERHILSCADCRALYEGQLPEPDRSGNVIDELRKKLRFFMFMVLIFGVLYGVSLTAGEGLFLNAVIMPVIGAVGYYLLRGKAVYGVPAMILVTHLVTNTFGLLRGVEHLDILTLLMWCGLYSLFAVLGAVTAWLLHFALGKEEHHEK